MIFGLIGSARSTDQIWLDIVYIRYFAYFLEKVLDGEVLVVVVQTWFLRKKKEKKKLDFSLAKEVILDGIDPRRRRISSAYW